MASFNLTKAALMHLCISRLWKRQIDALNEGAKVEFELEVGRNGKQAAANLKLL